jgi:DUF4097 and DUF4098 domain-containing protein YvlB
MHRLLRTGRIAAAAAALLAAGCHLNDPYVAIGDVATAHPSAGISRLVVNDPVGSVHLRPAADERVSVTARVSVRASLQTTYPTADLARDVRIVADQATLTIANAHAEGGHGDDFELDLEIAAPARLAWSVVVGAGGAEIEGGGNDVDANVGAGDVALRGAIAKLAAQSGAGSVRAELASLDGGHLEAGAGGVALTIAGGTLAHDLTCVSGAGSIQIAVPSTLAAEVALTTGVGALNVQGAGLEVRSSVVGGSAHGRLGAGGPQLTATAGTGALTFRVAP